MKKAAVNEKIDLIKKLQFIRPNTPGYLVEKGFEFVHYYLNFPLKSISNFNLSKSDAECVADLYMLKGDLADLLSCPNVALQSYKYASKYSKGTFVTANAYFEISQIYVDIGDKKNALLNLKKAIALKDDCEQFYETQNEIAKYGLSKSHSLYSLSSWKTKASEAMYCGNWKRANSILYRKKRKNSLPFKFRLEGARGSEVFFKLFEELLETKDYQFDYADWFYIKPVLWNQSRFWNYVEEARKRKLSVCLERKFTRNSKEDA
ncbi:MAG: hypothetical protein KDD61_01425 [Bdellovibrionales bacterium]|nr:hypothetical protein [Bdellovibrionales bacterium]